MPLTGKYYKNQLQNHKPASYRIMNREDKTMQAMYYYVNLFSIVVST